MSFLRDNDLKPIGIVAVTRDITERKRTEKVLHDSEEKYRMLVEHQGEGIIIADFDETITYANPTGELIFGVPAGALAGRHVTEFITSEAAERLASETAKRREGKQSKYTLEINRPSGEIRTLIVTAVPQQDGDGNAVGTQAIIQDVTDSKRVEKEREKIRAWQAGVNRILESILTPVPIEQKMKIITDGVVETFGADFCRIWLIEKGDLCNTDCMHADAVEGPHVCRYRDQCLHLTASSGRYTHIDGKGHRRVPFGAYKIGRIASGEETKFLTNDVGHDPRVHNNEWAKSLGLVAFAGYRLKPTDGEVLGVFTLFAKFQISRDMDILLEGLSRAISLAIQKDKVDEALRASDDRYHQLVDNTDTGFVVIDNKGYVIEANEPYMRLMGAEKRDEIIGHSAIEWTAPEAQERNAEAMALCARQGFIQDYETIYLHRNGSRGQISINATTQETTDGKCVVAFCRNITERKQADMELRKLSAAVEQGANVVVITDLDANIVYVNQAFINLTGYSRDEAIGKNPRILKSGEIDRSVYQQMWQVLLSGGKWSGEFHNKKKNGDRFWEQATITSIKDEQGKPAFYMAVKEDITEQKQDRLLQDSLYQIAELMATTETMDELCVGIHWIIGQLMPVTSLSIATIDDSTGVISIPYHAGEPDLVPTSGTLMNGLVEQVLRSGGPVLRNRETGQAPGLVDSIGNLATTWLGIPLCNRGKTFGALVVQQHDSVDGYTKREIDILSFVADNVAAVILWKKSETALAMSEHRFRQVTSSTNEWVWEIDPDGLYTYTNGAVSKILGYNTNELVGKKHYYDFFLLEIPDELRQAALAGFSQRRPIRSFVIPNQHKDGHVVTLEMNCMPFFSSERVFLGYRGTSKDITIRRALEEDRERLIGELQDSLDNIKTLKGLVPICSSCKKIRNDKGYWQQVEVYVAEHTEADFSHGLCEECAHKLYPEYFPDKKNQGS